MTQENSPRYIRLSLELIVELTNADELKAGALAELNSDEQIPADAKAEAAEAVRADTTEALAFFIDPFAVLGEAPGIELQEVAWDAEFTEYDPDAEDEIS